MMKFLILSIAGLALAGCNVAQLDSQIALDAAIVKKDINGVSTAMPKACADLASLTGSINQAAGQVAAANPQAGSTASKVANATAGANSTCASLSAAASSLATPSTP